MSQFASVIFFLWCQRLHRKAIKYNLGSGLFTGTLAQYIVNVLSLHNAVQSHWDIAPGSAADNRRDNTECDNRASNHPTTVTAMYSQLPKNAKNECAFIKTYLFLYKHLSL